jgi:uncharacterized protein
MIEWFTMASWSPYIVGVGIGVLIWAMFLLSDRPLGCSTAYAKSAGMVETAMSRKNAEQMAYYQKVQPTIDWQWMLIIGVIIGAFVSAYLSDAFTISIVPPVFGEAFGTEAIFRFVVALIGGILMGVGARWADGCTSGHGISGTLQLSLSSWIAVICFFAAGIIVAELIY